MCVEEKREFPGVLLLENRGGAALGAVGSNGLASLAVAR